MRKLKRNMRKRRRSRQMNALRRIVVGLAFLVAMQGAGADLIISYHARDVARWLGA